MFIRLPASAASCFKLILQTPFVHFTTQAGVRTEGDVVIDYMHVPDACTMRQITLELSLRSAQTHYSVTKRFAQEQIAMRYQSVQHSAADHGVGFYSSCEEMKRFLAIV